MTLYELLKMNKSLLLVFMKNEIHLKDVSNLVIYEQFKAMKKQQLKTAYIVEMLATSFHTSTRTIYDVIKRFNTDIVL